MLTTDSILNRTLNYMVKLNLSDRWKMAKDLGSDIVYGENGFGDAEKLQKSLAKNKEGIALDTKPDHNINYTVISVLLDGTDNPDQTKNTFHFKVLSSNKPLKDFVGKDYLFDISPEVILVIFPDLTFSISTLMITGVSWQEWRSVLEEKGLFDADYEGNVESLVSLDKLRKQMGTVEMTELELRDLRRKMYGFAYAIDKQIRSV